MIECDGNYWHSYPTGTETDHIRTKELIENGKIEVHETDIRKYSRKDQVKKLAEIINTEKSIRILYKAILFTSCIRADRLDPIINFRF